MEMGRRMSDKEDGGHFEITQRNVRDIGEIRTDIAGLKVGVDGLAETMHRISKQLSQLTQPKETEWTAVGSLIIAVVLVFGGIFGFLFNAQSSSTEDSLIAVQRESDLRHEIRDLHERNLTAQVVRLQDRVLLKMERQEKLNLEFSKRTGAH